MEFLVYFFAILEGEREGVREIEESDAYIYLSKFEFEF